MDWITAARDLGFPAVIIAGMGYAIWTAGKYLGKELLVPLRDRHFDFLQSLEQTNKTIAERCSTPFGITEANTSPVLPRLTGLQEVLNAFRHH